MSGWVMTTYTCIMLQVCHGATYRYGYATYLLIFLLDRRIIWGCDLYLYFRVTYSHENVVHMDSMHLFLRHAVLCQNCAHCIHHNHHLFAQNTIKVHSGYVNEQDRKAHCALTSAHNITSTMKRNTHSTIHGIGVTRNR